MRKLIGGAPIFKMSIFLTRDSIIRHRFDAFFYVLFLSAFFFSFGTYAMTSTRCALFYNGTEEAELSRLFSERTSTRRLAPAIGGAHYERILPENRLWASTLFHPKYQPTGLTFNSRDTRFIDQQMSMECPIFAFINAVETTYANHPTQPKIVELDPTFLIGAKLHRYIEKAIDHEPGFLYDMDAYTPTLRGGEFHNILDIALSFGNVPAKIWRPILPLAGWTFPTKDPDAPNVYSDIFKAVDTFHADVAKGLIPRVGKGQPGYTQWRKNAADAIFTNTLKNSFGEWPFPFSAEGYSDLTPKRYGSLVGPAKKEVPELIYMTPYPYDNATWTNRLFSFFNEMYPHSKKLFTHHQSNSTEFYEKILTALSNNKAIVLDTNGSKGPGGPGHSFAIVDVEVRDGKVVAVRLKNSYRNWPGGYGWFSIKELNKHIRRAWIFDII